MRTRSSRRTEGTIRGHVHRGCGAPWLVVVTAGEPRARPPWLWCSMAAAGVLTPSRHRCRSVSLRCTAPRHVSCALPHDPSGDHRVVGSLWPFYMWRDREQTIEAGGERERWQSRPRESGEKHESRPSTRAVRQRGLSGVVRQMRDVRPDAHAPGYNLYANEVRTLEYTYNRRSVANLMLVTAKSKTHKDQSATQTSTRR